MKVKTKHDDVHGRWKAGEIGECIENTFPEKYKYIVDFGVIEKREVRDQEQNDLDEACAAFGLGKILCSGEIRKVISFFSDEVEVIEE